MGWLKAPKDVTLPCQVRGEQVVRIGHVDIANLTGTDPYPIGSGVPEILVWVGAAVGQAIEAAKAHRYYNRLYFWSKRCL